MPKDAASGFDDGASTLHILMPAERGTRQRDRRSSDPTYSKKVEDTLRRVEDAEFTTFREAERQTGVCYVLLTLLVGSTISYFQKPKSALFDRAKQ